MVMVILVLVENIAIHCDGHNGGPDQGDDQGDDGCGDDHTKGNVKVWMGQQS